MSKSLRLLMVAAALSIAVATSATAQTVIVKGAKPGGRVEVVVNDAPANAGTIAADGTATVAGNVPVSGPGRAEMDARLYLDVCDTVQRVLVIDRNRLPTPATDGCARTEISGIYWVRPRSTIVIDLSKPIPDVLLRQGTYNPNAPSRRLAPKGLVGFAGVGLNKTSDFPLIACGDVTDCADPGFTGAYNVGATFWITRWLGVEGNYLRPSKIVVTGNGGTYTFSNRLDVDFLNVVAKGGVPAGPVRIFGQGGLTYHEARDTMTETIGGGSQTVETHTDGWSYTFGGGLEGWISDRFALYFEAGRTKMKGKERLAEVIQIDDTLTHYMVGVRVRVF